MSPTLMYPQKEEKEAPARYWLLLTAFNSLKRPRWPPYHIFHGKKTTYCLYSSLYWMLFLPFFDKTYAISYNFVTLRSCNLQLWKLTTLKNRNFEKLQLCRLPASQTLKLWNFETLQLWILQLWNLAIFILNYVWLDGQV